MVFEPYSCCSEEEIVWVGSVRTLVAAVAVVGPFELAGTSTVELGLLECLQPLALEAGKPIAKN